MAFTQYYSGQPLAVGVQLFFDSGLTNPLNVAGYFSDGATCYETNASGTIIAVSACPGAPVTTTTLAPATTTTTADPGSPTTTTTVDPGSPTTTTTTADPGSPTTTTTIVLPDPPGGCGANSFAVYNQLSANSFAVGIPKSADGTNELSVCSLAGDPGGIAPGESYGFNGAPTTGYTITLTYGSGTPDVLIDVYVDGILKETLAWDSSPKTFTVPASWGVQASSNVKFIVKNK